MTDWVLSTKRLRMRRLTEADARFALRLWNEPSFIENIGDKEIRTIEDAKESLNIGPIKSYTDNGFGMYMVCRAEDGACMGVCGLIDREGLDGIDLGYAFLPEFTGNGYATEAAEAVLEEARNRYDLREVVAIVASYNKASIRLLEKCGFMFQKMICLPGDDKEIKLLSLAL